MTEKTRPVEKPVGLWHFMKSMVKYVTKAWMKSLRRQYRLNGDENVNSSSVIVYISTSCTKNTTQWNKILDAEKPAQTSH